MESENRAKCVSLLTKVEQVLHSIYDTESAGQVAEAVKASARATKANTIDADEVDLCIGELEDIFNSQKKVEKTLASVSFLGIEDEDVEDELTKLELEVLKEDSSVEKEAPGTTATSLTDALLNLKLSDAMADVPREQKSGPSSSGGSSRSPVLEAGAL